MKHARAQVSWSRTPGAIAYKVRVTQIQGGKRKVGAWHTINAVRYKVHRRLHPKIKYRVAVIPVFASGNGKTATRKFVFKQRR